MSEPNPPSPERSPDRDIPPEQIPPGGLWSRLKAHILHPELTPSQVAWSFALGLSIAWNPLLGLHTLMVLGLCLLSRHFHRPVMLLAAFTNNPWTLVPIATASVVFGNLLLGKGFALDLAGVAWHRIGLKTFLSWGGLQEAYGMLRPILGPYMLGGTVLSILVVPLGYGFMLWLTRRLRAHPLHFSRKPNPPHS